MTALQKAAKSDHLDPVQLLLESKSASESLDRQKRSMLM